MLQRSRPYKDPKTNVIRFHYVKYADDFIIVGNFSQDFAQQIKLELSKWLMKRISLPKRETKRENLNYRIKNLYY